MTKATFLLVLAVAGIATLGLRPPHPAVRGPEAAMRSESQAAARYGQIQELFDRKCVGCHGGEEAAQGLSLDSWEGLVAGSRHGEAVIAFDAGNSLLIEMVTKLRGGSHPSEQDAPVTTEEEVELLRAWVDEGALSPEGEVPFTGSRPLLYVANQGAAMVSVIDMEANLVVRTVDLERLGFGPSSMPHHVAVEPDGSFWYLTVIAENALLKFNRDNELVGRATLERPGLVALDPASDLLFVARSMIAVRPQSSISVVHRGDLSSEELGVFVPRPHALAVGPGGTYVFTGSLAVNQLAAVHVAEEAIDLTSLEGDRPHTFIGLAVSPDGRVMAGTTELTGKVFLFELDRLPDLTPADTIDVNPAPWHPVFTPDGRWLYVGSNWDNSVVVIDMESREIAKTIRGTGLAQPHGAAVSPDGRYVYISSRNLPMPAGHTKADHVYAPRYDFGDNANVGTVTVIDTRTQEITKVIEIEEYGAGMGTAAVAAAAPGR